MNFPIDFCPICNSELIKKIESNICPIQNCFDDRHDFIDDDWRPHYEIVNNKRKEIAYIMIDKYEIIYFDHQKSSIRWMANGQLNILDFDYHIDYTNKDKVETLVFFA